MKPVKLEATMVRVPNEFTLSGSTQSQHILHGVAKDPAHCAEKLSVADAWRKKFGQTPKTLLVDSDRVRIKHDRKWYWAVPTAQMVHNLKSLDNGKRYELKPHKWKITVVFEKDAVPMTETDRKRIRTTSDKNRRLASQRPPTVRRRIDGLTKIIAAE